MKIDGVVVAQKFVNGEIVSLIDLYDPRWPNATVGDGNGAFAIAEALPLGTPVEITVAAKTEPPPEIEPAVLQGRMGWISKAMP